MTDPRGRSAATICAQALHFVDEVTGAVVPTVSFATTFARDDEYRLPDNRLYARDDNPTFEHAEGVIAALEDGAACRIFPTGLAAAHTAMTALLKPGDTVVATGVMYFGVRKLLRNFASQFNVKLVLVDGTDIVQLGEAVRTERPALVWIETPGNPTLDVVDIAAAARATHEIEGARLIVDSTAATPIHTRPLSLGADIVMHSATKYLNGHSDVLAGALVSARTADVDDGWRRICELRHDAGVVPGPLDAWLLLRGMRTLSVRVERQSASALTIARALRAMKGVTHVLYPGLDDHPNHDVAVRQMRGGFGGLLSIRVDGGAERALRVANRLQLFLRATSLGGTESLVEHRGSVEGPDSPTPNDLLRLAIGLEDPAELLADLEQALS